MGIKHGIKLNPEANDWAEDGMQTFWHKFAVVCPTILLGKTYDHALEGGEESRDFASGASRSDFSDGVR